MTIELSGVSARGAAERGRARTVLTNVSFEHRSGLLGVIGAHKDGTALLLDVIVGSVKPRSGHVVVLGATPDEVRTRIARVSLDAPLPESLRVDEVCDLAADVRAETRRPASERLGMLGVGALARRRVRSLSLEERRAVSLAIALTSKAQIILVEEPLAAIDPVAPRLVVDALRARSDEACIVITTASARDATRLADRLGVLTAGVYTALPPDLAHMELGTEGGVSVRLLVSPSHGQSGAAALVAELSSDVAVARVDTSLHAGRSGVVAIVVSGRELASLSQAITHAIAMAKVDVEVIEPNVLPLDAIRAALAARALSPPPGSLPPSSGSVPPPSGGAA